VAVDEVLGDEAPTLVAKGFGRTSELFELVAVDEVLGDEAPTLVAIDFG